MSRDIHNFLRGQCLSCSECPSFICISGKVLCDYCGCPPAKHQRESDEESSLPERYIGWLVGSEETIHMPQQLCVGYDSAGRGKLLYDGQNIAGLVLVFQRR